MSIELPTSSADAAYNLSRAVLKATTVESFIVPPSAVTCGSAAESAWFAVNRMNVMRFTLDRPTIVSRVILDCTVASGNMESCIYSVTRTALDTYSLVKVATTGVIAVPAPATNVIKPAFAPETLLQPGQYAWGLWVDNTTAAFCHNLLNTLARSGWGLPDNGASAGGAPASYTSSSGQGGRAFAGCIEAAIPS